MKSLKLSFAFIFAVVAIGMTIVANAGTFKNTKISVAAGSCFTDLDGVNNQSGSCSPFDLIRNTNTCQEGTLKIGKDVTAFTGTVIPQADITSECPGGARFCCAQLVKYTPPTPVPACLHQIIVDGVQGYYKIDAVACKAQ